ncbi:hypothetical protein C7974DRAFT_78423 [Boeremia exigua]|uniref:uncharacterized protein n=1 Tax=Boeremia exigua TaxID=749465 RepID=UPI001E8D3EAC|nr:uncharacterized protein C7974DRAFT_78423 [Boeremia exigua]KAH6612477.1 hypothetical protein C7974DRAFT_78423 [Boeremia exigua]
MFIDTTLNSVSTVLTNLHQSFHEAAVRCLEYVRMLAKVRTTCSSLLISAFTSRLKFPNAAVRFPEMLAFPASHNDAASVVAQIKRNTSHLQRRSARLLLPIKWADE